MSLPRDRPQCKRRATSHLFSFDILDQLDESTRPQLDRASLRPGGDGRKVDDRVLRGAHIRCGHFEGLYVWWGKSRLRGNRGSRGRDVGSSIGSNVTLVEIVPLYLLGPRVRFPLFLLRLKFKASKR